MVKKCKNSRDKAILIALYDGGFRVGEFLNIKIGHLEHMDKAISVVVHGKTGSRNVLMPIAEPYLNRWLENHPDPRNENYLWVNISNRNYGDPLSYQSLRKMLKKMKDEANLGCKVNPHALRKASATYYAQHLNKVQLCDRYGWVYGSDMPRVYIKKS
ncbi:MAG: XerD/XerC family integrase [Candidatus Methanohalarchaeum thermophilum]|uniref:XerD/XerC family integrase n=1 Tax=Methanohalarchaeum thermophilum TaxID=1903181 RepID=A0A1Q6DVY4_METT1|nr:MAG: XerD/XerC family integrase [Candidatus Methanohalarchaeum thermophilum]